MKSAGCGIGLISGRPRGSRMSKPPKIDFKALVAGNAPIAGPAPAELGESDREVVTLRPRRPAAVEGFSKGAGKGGTLKERAHQLSVYLEVPVYNALRDGA